MDSSRLSRHYALLIVHATKKKKKKKEKKKKENASNLTLRVERLGAQIINV